MIEEKLYAQLQEITETFEGVVPEDYTGYPVIRYASILSSTSLKGDDAFVHLANRYQIDLYERVRDKELKNKILKMIQENHYGLLEIKPSTEGDIKRLLFEIKIEE